jgi:hypothetical protein
MAQELRCDYRCRRRFFAGGKCGYALLFTAERVGVCSKNFAQTYVAGAKPAAPDQDRRGLDASGRGDCNPRGPDLVSAHRSRWAAHAERFT